MAAAKAFVRQAIVRGPGCHAGRGAGPLIQSAQLRFETLTAFCVPYSQFSLEASRADEVGRTWPDDFYESIPVLDNFADAVRAENYRPLPDDWVVGFADVVGSTKAVADGRYKAVNMVGAGAIAAVANALDRRPFPFVFGGDGASFAVSPSDAPAAAKALQAMAGFRARGVPFRFPGRDGSGRRNPGGGLDVRVARFAAAPPCVYAMFAGGGLTWFDAAAKRGAYALPPAEPGARPDLSGLSCRWGVAPAKHGLVLSLIVAPRGNDARFATLINEIVKSSLAAASSERPVTAESLRPGEPGKAIALETPVKKASGMSQAQGACSRQFAATASRSSSIVSSSRWVGLTRRPMRATSSPTPIFASSTTACA